MKFADVSKSAGIDFLQQNSKTNRRYLIETMGSGGGFFDYNRDGFLDIVLLNNTLIPGGKVVGRPTIALYRNNKNGTFTDVAKAAGLAVDAYAMGCSAGDYDNDGYDDLYVTAVLGPSRLFHNEGNGTFKDVAAAAGVTNVGLWGTSCAWLDYDKDGKLDLFVCNYVKYRTLKDDQPCYSGDNHKQVYCDPAAYESSHCTLYRNLGSGRFADVSTASGIVTGKSKGLGVTVWDIDGDGWLDIFVANDTVPGFLFKNNGNGTFTDIGVESGVAYSEEGIPHSGMGIDADDVGNDGKATLAITNYWGQQTSFYNQVSSEMFRDNRQAAGIGNATNHALGFGVFFFDHDNDGLKDMLQVNGHVQDDIQEREPDTPWRQPALLFRNMGNATFQEVGLKSGAPFSTKVVGRGAAWGDYDNDGKLDVLVMPNSGKAMLWRNETPTPNHWLKLKLEGVRSNRNGIGATVLVTSAGITQKTLVRCGSSYLSQSDLRPHFGLGSATAADVEIRWPSGQVDKFKGVATDRIHSAREGEAALK